MKTAVLCIVLVSACAADRSPDDVVGPFTGETHRYVVDSFAFPHNNADARALAEDLNGDDVLDNGIGTLIAGLSDSDDVNLHAADILAAGTIASSVEIVADDLTTDDTVSVIYIGADGAPASLVGGTFANGIFSSNRTRTTHVPGIAELHLPVFQDAGPSILPLIDVEIDLTPDGAGGFDAVIRGGVPGSTTLDVASQGMAEMVASNPAAHRSVIQMFDAPPQDHVVTPAEVATNSLMMALCAPDTELPRDNGQPTVSAAIGMHLRPCDAGSCNLSASFDRCFDRILDGDETDIDCGGSCRSCEAGAF